MHLLIEQWCLLSYYYSLYLIKKTISSFKVNLPYKKSLPIVRLQDGLKLLIAFVHNNVIIR